jgi:hypothetical protein
LCCVVQLIALILFSQHKKTFLSIFMVGEIILFPKVFLLFSLIFFTFSNFFNKGDTFPSPVYGFLSPYKGVMIALIYAVIALLWWMIILQQNQFCSWLKRLILLMHMYTRQSYWSGGTLGALLMRIEDTNYHQSTIPVDNGEWHHVVVQRCQGQVQFYVDGQLNVTATSNKNATTDADLLLGLDPKSSFDTEWEGLIDEVAVYDCCLSPETINCHYECGTNATQIEVMAGENDNFDPDPDISQASPSPALVAYCESNAVQVVGFDSWMIDKHFIHTFQWDCETITKAWLEVRIKVLGGQPETDSFTLWFSEDDYEGVSYEIWDENDSTGQTMTIVLDLGELPASGTLITATSGSMYPPVSLLTELNETGYLDLKIQDDTSVDYAKLTLCCECGEWEDVTVTWISPSGTQESWTGSCGETSGPVIIPLGTPIEINTSITCGPSPPCLEPSYEWEVTEVGPGPPFSASGVTLPISFIPTATGWNTFEVKLSASCGDSPCKSCTIRMRVNPSGPCIDIKKKVVDPTTGQLIDNIEVPDGTEVDSVITVCNCGTSDLGPIKVVEEFPDCLEYVKSDASVNIDDIGISGNQVVWYFSSLKLHPGDCFDMKVKAMVVSEGDNKNCVEVYADSHGGSISDGDCAAVNVNGKEAADTAPEGSEESGGQCLGSTLLIGILALGAIALIRKKD